LKQKSIGPILKTEGIEEIMKKTQQVPVWREREKCSQIQKVLEKQDFLAVKYVTGVFLKFGVEVGVE
jgi:hypothetical protein